MGSEMESQQQDEEIVPFTWEELEQDRPIPDSDAEPLDEEEHQ